MSLSDYDYNLPQELIAQDPIKDRSSSRLLVLERGTGRIFHDHFYNIGKYLNSGDSLIINDTRVIPARLLGNRSTGAAVEVLLLKRLEGDLWEALTRPGKRTNPGSRLVFGDGLLEAEVVEVLDEGVRTVRFFYEGIFEEILDKIGQMPLPPYIKNRLEEKGRYQTVYAKYDGSAAAPTAGLHFTRELMDELKAAGIDIGEVTLHVGLGTFRPVSEENILLHKMHSECYKIEKNTADLINRTRERGGRVIAVGTTSVRTLETAAQGQNGLFGPAEGDTDIFIYPGFNFRAVDGIVTNFHLPKSTLLMLISAFAGREKVLKAYEEAVKSGYRFFSFGDAMLII